MAYLKENNFHAMTISNLVTAIRVGGNLPQKPLVITFDDGNDNILRMRFQSCSDLVILV